MIKLSKKLITGPHRGAIGTVLVNEEFVSNGHWMIRRSSLSKQQRHFTASPETAGEVFGVLAQEMTDTMAAKVMESHARLTAYESTFWEYLGGLYLQPVKGKQVRMVVHSYYWHALGFDQVPCVFAKRDPHAVIFDNKAEPFNVLVMPMRSDDPPEWVQEAMANGRP